jgi:hypothetical protein
MSLAQPALTPSTATNIVQAFAQHRLPLSDDQADLLVTHWGLDALRALFRGDSPDLEYQRKDAHFLVRVMDRLGRHGLPVTLAEARALAESTGRQALTQRLVDAFQERNPAALRALQLQIESLRREPDVDAPAPALGRAPIHRTTLPPPVARPVETSAPSEAVIVTRTAPPARSQDNVRALPPARPAAEPPAESTASRSYAPESDTAPPRGEARYDQHSCFGKDVAVTFECTPNRDRTAHTVNIKVANAKGTTCKQGVDWANGIIIALEPHEVQTCLAVLWNMGESVRYAGHGADNQKWFQFSENTGNYAGALRLTVAHGQDKRSVNIGATDAGEVIGIFVRAALSQLRIPAELLAPTVQRAYDLYLKNADRRASDQAQPSSQRRTG